MIPIIIILFLLFERKFLNLSFADDIAKCALLSNVMQVFILSRSAHFD